MNPSSYHPDKYPTEVNYGERDVFGWVAEDGIDHHCREGVKTRAVPFASGYITKAKRKAKRVGEGRRGVQLYPQGPFLLACIFCFYLRLKSQRLQTLPKQPYGDQRLRYLTCREYWSSKSQREVSGFNIASHPGRMKSLVDVHSHKFQERQAILGARSLSSWNSREGSSGKRYWGLPDERNMCSGVKKGIQAGTLMAISEE